LNRRSTAGGGLGRERRAIQDGVGKAPVNQGKGRSGGQRAQLEAGRHVAAERKRIVTLRNFVVEQLHSLHRKALQERRLQVPGEFLVEAFGVDVRIEGQRCPSPSVGEFPACKREPPGGDGVEGDVSSVEADGLAI